MKYFLYVADDIETLQNGKALIVGAYGDRRLNIAVPLQEREKISKDSPVHVRFSLMVSFGDLDVGPYKCTLSIVRPDGIRTDITQDFDASVQPGQAGFNLILNLPVFPVWGTGTYLLSGHINGDAVELPFEIQFREN